MWYWIEGIALFVIGLAIYRIYYHKWIVSGKWAYAAFKYDPQAAKEWVTRLPAVFNTKLTKE